MPAALLAIEARAQKDDAAFFKAADRLFEIAPELEDHKLLEVARELGLDLDRTRRAIARTTHPQIEADMDLAMDFQARGTPHFFINGRRLSGAQPLEAFVAAVERAEKEARELMSRRKIAARDVYAAIMETARLPEPPEKKSVPAPTAENPSRGPAGAPVMIQMFAGFQCPFSKKVLPTLRELEQAFPKKIRIVWRNLPLEFHRQSRITAAAALEAFAQKGDAGFWKMHDALFEHQEDRDAFANERLEQYAREAGLDVAPISHGARRWPSQCRDRPRPRRR